MTSPDMIKLTTKTWDDNDHPAWEVSGPLGRVLYRSLENHLYLDPRNGATDAGGKELTDEARIIAATGSEKQMYLLLTALYRLFPAPPDGAPAGVLAWRELRGAGLTDAMRRAKWFAWPDDTIGGWAVMPVNVPPSTGAPAVGSFLAEDLARHISDLHNAALPTFTAEPGR